jgi:hypothetical protein
LGLDAVVHACNYNYEETEIGSIAVQWQSKQKVSENHLKQYAESGGICL